MTPPNPLWFVDRSTGELTLLLLSCAVVLGIVRSAVPALSPVLVEGLHVNLALLVAGFAAVHVIAAVADPYAHLGVLDALVPFASAYRSTWLGLGVVSAYAYAIAVLTSWPARRLPRAAWQWLHRTMYLAWVLAIVHSIGTGSDATNRLFLILDFAAVMAVLLAFLGYRVAEAWPVMPPLWGSLAAVAVLVVVALAVWAVNGPLQPGWARTSGTPPGLLQPH